MQTVFACVKDCAVHRHTFGAGVTVHVIETGRFSKWPVVLDNLLGARPEREVWIVSPTHCLLAV